jgi:Phosphotransferase enzyme family
MEYVLPEYNYGPFILMHGDFCSSNIIVDENLNIVSVIDWEWSRTVPAQLLVPPEWLTGYEVNGLLSVYNKLRYMRELFNFRNIVRDREKNLMYHWSNNKQEDVMPAVPLSELWRTINQNASFFIAHALLRFHVLGDIYWDCLDRRYHGTDPEGRINDFYSTQATECQLEIVKKKLDDLAIYEKELEDLGIEKDQSKELPETVQIQTNSLKTIVTDGNEAKGVVFHSRALFTCLSLLSGR